MDCAIMSDLVKSLLVVCALVMATASSPAHAQFREDKTIQDSIEVLNEIMSIPAQGIPRKMLDDAQAVAIIPRVIKGSFVVGARRGNGVVMVRDDNGQWSAPTFISLTGGNIGWQAGIQSTDVVLVFKTRKSVEGLLSGKMTLGADAAVAAGPVGRQAAAATDVNLGTQIYSYSRSRGLFVGVALDGSVIRLDPMSNAAYYRPTSTGAPAAIPPRAEQLAQQVIQYVEGPTATPVAGDTRPPAQQAGWKPPSLQQPHSMAEVDHLRDELAKLAPELYELLDANWQQYLGLPAQVFQGNGHPSADQLSQSLSRFESVRQDPRYATLANHPKFQSTYGLLKHYYQDLSQTSEQLNLPAPPRGPGGIQLP